MTKRIPVYEIIDGEPISKMMVFKKSIIEIRSVKILHTKKDYSMNPMEITYSNWRSSYCGKKDFSSIRDVSTPWILEIKEGDKRKRTFRVDSEKGMDQIKANIKKLRMKMIANL